MPKKKHRRGAQRPPRRHQGRPSPGAHTGSRERDIQALLAQFALWRRESADQGQADDDAQHVEPLLRLKAEQLDSPDPGYWTEELIEVLLTQVVPRKVVQPREMTMEQVPALGRFFAFLQSRGRWHPEGIDAQHARQVLESLEFAALEAADDPTARSFTGNLLTYAASLGVGLEDPRAYEAFVQWYNTELTDAQRHEISDTGRLTDPSVRFEPRAASARDGRPSQQAGSAFFPDASGQDDAWDLGDLDPLDALDEAPSWPWFLPEEDDAAGAVGALAQTDDAPASFAAMHAELPLVDRAARLLEFVGEGRQVTSTGALRRADVGTLVEDWGIDLGPRKAASMWQIDEITGPWMALTSGGWLEVSSTRVRRGDGIAPYAPAADDPEAFTLFARALLSILLLTLATDDSDESGLRGSPDTFAALLCAASGDGLTLPDPYADGPDMPLVPRSAGGGPDVREVMRLGRTRIDLATLAAYGYLWRDADPAGMADHYRGNHAVTAAVISVIDMLNQGPEGP